MSSEGPADLFEAASQVQAFAASARGMRNMRDEQSMYPTAFDQAKALTSLDDDGHSLGNPEIPFCLELNPIGHR